MVVNTRVHLKVIVKFMAFDLKRLYLKLRSKMVYQRENEKNHKGND